MFDAFSELIERRVAAVGYRKTLLWPSALLTLLAGLGGVALGPFLAGLAVALLLLYLVSIIIVLLLNRRELLTGIGQLQDATRRYVEKLTATQQNDPNFFTIQEWDEQLAVDPNGDATISRWLTLEVGSKVLDLVWSNAFINPTPHWKAADQPSVKVSARGFDAVKADGARLTTTLHWLSSEKLRLFVHLPQEVPPGQVVRVRIDITWPRYAKTMLDGAGDDVTWTLSRRCHLLKFRMVVPKKTGIRQLRLTPRHGCNVPLQANDNDGNLTLAFEHRSPTPGQTIGFRLDAVR